MAISNVGRATIPTSSPPLHLDHILPVPSANKSLLSIQRFTSNKDVFFELHPNFFVVKDWVTKMPMPHGRYKGGLYPLPLANVVSLMKSVFGVSKPSTTRWHGCLGHACVDIVHHVISSNNLPHTREGHVVPVCDACM